MAVSDPSVADDPEAGVVAAVKLIVGQADAETNKVVLRTQPAPSFADTV